MKCMVCRIYCRLVSNRVVNCPKTKSKLPLKMHSLLGDHSAFKFHSIKTISIGLQLVVGMRLDSVFQFWGGHQVRGG